MFAFPSNACLYCLVMRLRLIRLPILSSTSLRLFCAFAGTGRASVSLSRHISSISLEFWNRYNEMQKSVFFSCRNERSEAEEETKNVERNKISPFALWKSVQKCQKNIFCFVITPVLSEAERIVLIFLSLCYVSETSGWDLNVQRQRNGGERERAKDWWKWYGEEYSLMARGSPPLSSFGFGFEGQFQLIYSFELCCDTFNQSIKTFSKRATSAGADRTKNTNNFTLFDVFPVSSFAGTMYCPFPSQSLQLQLKLSIRFQIIHFRSVQPFEHDNIADCGRPHARRRAPLRRRLHRLGRDLSAPDQQVIFLFRMRCLIK